MLAGEITTNATFDYDKIVRQAVKEIGYTDTSEPFCDTTLKVISLITKQSNEISQGVTATTSQSGDQGAGDQGIMFGYASDESRRADAAADRARAQAHLRPRRRIARPTASTSSAPTASRRSRSPTTATPPSRSRAVVVSTQHTPAADQKRITEYVREDLGPRVLGPWWRKDVQLFVNPTGSFTHGGPSADAGVTGRKIIVDTYGGWGRHGGGAFSGKDPSKVDRSSRVLLPLRRAPGDRRRASRRRPRFRSATPSAWPSRCRSRSTRSAPATSARPPST